MNTLPDKPSELIKVALADLKKAEQDPRYKINMGAWHTGRKYQGETTCKVCFAGAVIAFSLGANLNEMMLPSLFDEVTRYKLFFLNRARDAKSVGELLVRWRLFIHKSLHNKVDKNARKALPAAIDYEDDVEGFHKRMNKVAKILEELGL